MSKKKKAKMGRPPVPKLQQTVSVSVSLPRPLVRIVKAEAEARGVSFSRVVVAILDDRLIGSRQFNSLGR